MKLQIHGNRIEWNGGRLELSIPVKEAILLGQHVLVIHDYVAYDRAKPAPNLVAYSPSGEQVWTAQNLTPTSPTDAYVNLFPKSHFGLGISQAAIVRLTHRQESCLKVFLLNRRSNKQDAVDPAIASRLHSDPLGSLIRKGSPLHAA